MLHWAWLSKCFHRTCWRGISCSPPCTHPLVVALRTCIKSLLHLYFEHPSKQNPGYSPKHTFGWGSFQSSENVLNQLCCRLSIVHAQACLLWWWPFVMLPTWVFSNVVCSFVYVFGFATDIQSVSTTLPNDIFIASFACHSYSPIYK